MVAIHTPLLVAVFAAVALGAKRVAVTDLPTSKENSPGNGGLLHFAYQAKDFPVDETLVKMRPWTVWGTRKTVTCDNLHATGPMDAEGFTPVACQLPSTLTHNHYKLFLENKATGDQSKWTSYFPVDKSVTDQVNEAGETIRKDAEHAAGKVGDAAHQVNAEAQTQAAAARGRANEAAQGAKERAEQLGDKTQHASHSLKESLADAAHRTGAALKHGEESVVEGSKGLFARFKFFGNKAKDNTKEAAHNAADKAADVTAAGLEKTSEAAQQGAERVEANKPGSGAAQLTVPAWSGLAMVLVSLVVVLVV